MKKALADRALKAQLDHHAEGDEMPRLSPEGTTAGAPEAEERVCTIKGQTTISACEALDIVAATASTDI